MIAKKLVVEIKFTDRPTGPTDDPELVLLVKQGASNGTRQFLSELANVAGKHACTISAKFIKSP